MLWKICLKGSLYSSLRQCRLISSGWDGKTAFTCKDSSDLRGSVCPAVSKSSHMSLFHLSGFLPSQCSYFNITHLARQKFTSCFNSATDRIWFSTISVLQQLEIRVCFRADRDFRSLMWHLSWEFKSPRSSFSFPTLFTNFWNKQWILLYSLV